MSKSIKSNGFTIQRYIEKDKVKVERWGKVWFKFNLAHNLMDGCACVSMLHKYLPNHVMEDVKKTWKKDF